MPVIIIPPSHPVTNGVQSVPLTYDERILLAGLMIVFGIALIIILWWIDKDERKED